MRGLFTNSTAPTVGAAGVRPLAMIAYFAGEVPGDPPKPDGQPRRALDTSRARERFGFVAKTQLAAGLLETVGSKPEFGSDQPFPHGVA
jgi:nucleoside-diphosphate-sugar epimerase